MFSAYIGNLCPGAGPQAAGLTCLYALRAYILPLAASIVRPDSLVLPRIMAWTSAIQVACPGAEHSCQAHLRSIWGPELLPGGAVAHGDGDRALHTRLPSGWQRSPC